MFCQKEIHELYSLIAFPCFPRFVGGLRRIIGTCGDLADGRYCVRVIKQTVCTKDRVPTNEQAAIARQFAPEPGKHIVWLLRNSKYGSQRTLPITVAGVSVETLPYTISRVVVEPGIQSVALSTNRETDEIVLDAAADKQTFVEIAAHFGLLRTTVSLRHVSEAEGRKMASAGKLINDTNDKRVAQAKP